MKDGSVTSVVCISQVEPFAVFHGTIGFRPVWGFVPLHHVVLVVAMPYVLFFALQTPLMALCGASSPLVAGDAVTLCVAVTSITWQAWYNRTSTFISRGQAWHNLRSTFVLRGRPGTLTKLGNVVDQLYCPFRTTQGVVGGMLLPLRSSAPWVFCFPSLFFTRSFRVFVGAWGTLSLLRFYEYPIDWLRQKFV